MKQRGYPEGWDESRIRKVAEHYETQSEHDAIREDEAAYESITHTMMSVPVGLVAKIRNLIARRRAG